MALTKKQMDAEARKYFLKQIRDSKTPKYGTYGKKAYYSTYKSLGGRLSYTQATKTTTAKKRKTTKRKRKGC
jgi:hypothetical protein